MSDAQKQLLRLLAENKYALVRGHKHQVYRSPDGRIFVIPSTPSDSRWAKHALADFRRHITEPRTTGGSVVLEQTQIAKQIAEKIGKPHSAQMPNARRGKRSKGTGIRIIEKIVKLPTQEEKEISLAAATAERDRAAAIRQQRRDEKEFEQSCLRFVESGAERALSKIRQAATLLETANNDLIASVKRSNLQDGGSIHRLSEAETYAVALATGVRDYWGDTTFTLREIAEFFRGQRCQQKFRSMFLKQGKKYVHGFEIARQNGLPGVVLPCPKARLDVLLFDEFKKAMDEWHASMAIVKYEPPLFPPALQASYATAA